MTFASQGVRRLGQTGLARQVTSFVGIGLVSTALHYAILVALVQLASVPPVPAALTGFTIAGILSYRLNRTHTYASDRPHHEAAWRFGLVAGVAFVLTWLFMYLMVDRWHLPYLPAQVVTTAILMVWTFGANRLWTFRDDA